MNLHGLAEECLTTIPGIPEATIYGSGTPLSAEWKDENGSRHTAKIALRFLSAETPTGGFALGTVSIGKQMWTFRFRTFDSGIKAFCVNTTKNRPHLLATNCWYEGDPIDQELAKESRCTLCGQRREIKQAYCGGEALKHIARCRCCQPYPCGEKTAPLKEPALSQHALLTK